MSGLGGLSGGRGLTGRGGGGSRRRSDLAGRGSGGLGGSRGRLLGGGGRSRVQLGGGRAEGDGGREDVVYTDAVLRDVSNSEGC